MMRHTEPAPSPTAARSRAATITTWVLQIGAAAILAQTLFFKFTGAEEAVYIFSTLGVEPWGRIAAGAAELVIAALLVVPRTAALGAAAGAGMMVGAVGSHLGPLGIEVMDDGGLLFTLALVVLGACAGILALRRREVTTMLQAARAALHRR